MRLGAGGEVGQFAWPRKEDGSSRGPQGRAQAPNCCGDHQRGFIVVGGGLIRFIIFEAADERC